MKSKQITFFGDPKSAYPVLYRYKPNPGLIVLFYTSGKGIVMANGNSSYVTGNYYENMASIDNWDYVSPEIKFEISN